MSLSEGNIYRIITRGEDMGDSIYDMFNALEGYRAREIHNGLVVETPLLDSHNDHISVYIDYWPDFIVVSDDGYTVRDIGMDFESNVMNEKLRVCEFFFAVEKQNGLKFNKRKDEIYLLVDAPELRSAVDRIAGAVHSLYKLFHKE